MDFSRYESNTFSTIENLIRLINKTKKYGDLLEPVIVINEEMHTAIRFHPVYATDSKNVVLSTFMGAPVFIDKDADACKVFLLPVDSEDYQKLAVYLPTTENVPSEIPSDSNTEASEASTEAPETVISSEPVAKPASKAKKTKKS